MNKNERAFIELVKRSIKKEYIDDGYFDECNWEILLKMSFINSVAAILFYVANVQKSLPEEIRNYGTDTSLKFL